MDNNNRRKNDIESLDLTDEDMIKKKRGGGEILKKITLRRREI